MTTPQQREHYAKELIVEHVLESTRREIPFNWTMLRDLATVAIEAQVELEVEQLTRDWISKMGSRPINILPPEVPGE
jgi:GTPase Era involved in 16S rRNA processing